jgi:ketosteroid isomerase-like protein
MRQPPQQQQQSDALKQEILALEMRYWQAVKEKDSGTAARLSDDPCIVVGAQGVGELQREVFPKLMAQGRCDINDFSLEDVHMRQLGADVVALAYTVNEEMTVDGQKRTLKAFDTSVWKKEGNGWICVVHTETPAGSPFGAH